MQKKLSRLKKGARARVLYVKGEEKQRRRLLDLGIINNAVVEVKRVAPFGDPMEIYVRGYNLGIRKAQAEEIWTEVL